MESKLKKFLLFFSLLTILQVHLVFPVSYSIKEDSIHPENIKETLSYFNNREYRANFKLFYFIPINIATVITKSSVYGDTGVIKLEIKSPYYHKIESCINIKTGKPLWHKWYISSIFGKKNISALYDNDRGLIDYTLTLNDTEKTKKTLKFTSQPYDPLSALVFHLSNKIKKGKLEEGNTDMDILWYIGEIYHTSLIIKKEKNLFKIELSLGKSSKGWAYFDESGRPLVGEGYTIPVIGHAYIYDPEFENKLKK